MAILLLTPRIYRNMKWSITPKDMFDTVSMSPITNLYETESSVLATEEITSVTINGHTYNLANIGSDLSAFNNLNPTYIRNVYNQSVFQGLRTWAKGRTDILMYSGSKLFTFERPISSSLSATIAVSGVSSLVTKNSKNFEELPALEDLKNINYSAAAWIETNKNSSSDVLTREYDETVCSNPWATNIPDKQVWTEWSPNGTISSCQGASKEYWSEEQNYPLSGEQVEIWGNQNQTGVYSPIKITNDFISLKAQVTKLDDYNVRVAYAVPIRFSYIAASQYLTWRSFIGIVTTTQHELESYAFLDRITKITIQLNGLALDTTGNDISYSLNEAGTGLTEQTINKRIYKVEKNELFTLNTYYGNNPDQKWSRKFALEFLQKYQKGKYLLNLDVPAKWAIENKIHCNSQLKIKLQDNTYIERKDSPCVFEVKTIEKSFKNNEFTFSLGLLEV